MSSGAWLMAIRPRTLPAGVSPVLVGTGLAAGSGAARPALAVETAVCAMLLQIGANLANDYYDFKKGADAERVGPIRVTQAGLLTPRAVWWGMGVSLVAAAAIGVHLVSIGGWPILWIGLLSLIAAVAYTGGPFPFAYHGLGEVFVFAFFGLGAVGGTYILQASGYDLDAFVAGLGVGSLSAALLVVNNLRDLEPDAAVGKRTVAVRIGPRLTKAEYVALVALGLGIPVVGWWRLAWPATSLAALAVVPFCVRPTTRVLKGASAADFAPALGETARVVATYGLLLAAGLAWG